ncbi:hypothetical protein THAOC_15875 [Thalassiosira oceanica]|uniref:Uncharacterized protein n=1 Tax=Thalassiosira oceanica TaxID=159749 RepID=K0SQW5_THAOC|nr:hypothetical protein THAOC_15875 [Thalassiosira oceanica]|eukprot:EJK63461.1 hypothetical protein THAOC_15875 [Thalassiosira oceanica]
MTIPPRLLTLATVACSSFQTGARVGAAANTRNHNPAMMNRLVPNPGRYSRIRRRPLGPSAGGSAAPASGAAFVATANAGGSSRPAAFPLGSGGTTIRPAVAGHQQRRGGGRRPSAPFFSSLAIDFFEGDEPPHEGDGVAGLPLGLGSTLLRSEDLLAAPSAESEGVEAAARTGEASGEGDVSRGSGNGGGDPEPERPAPRNDGGDGDPLFDGLRSRPKPGGAWDPRDPLDWCAPFGSRSPADAERLSTLTRLGPGDDGYHDVSTVTCPDVTIVRTPAQAETVLAALTKAAEENPRGDPRVRHGGHGHRPQASRSRGARLRHVSVGLQRSGLRLRPGRRAGNSAVGRQPRRLARPPAGVQAVARGRACAQGLAQLRVRPARSVQRGDKRERLRGGYHAHGEAGRHEPDEVQPRVAQRRAPRREEGSDEGDIRREEAQEGRVRGGARRPAAHGEAAEGAEVQEEVDRVLCLRREEHVQPLHAPSRNSQSESIACPGGEANEAMGGDDSSFILFR